MVVLSLYSQDMTGVLGMSIIQQKNRVWRIVSEVPLANLSHLVLKLLSNCSSLLKRILYYSRLRTNCEIMHTLTLTLNTGSNIPVIGLGTWQSQPSQVEHVGFLV